MRQTAIALAPVNLLHAQRVVRAVRVSAIRLPIRPFGEWREQEMSNQTGQKKRTMDKSDSEASRLSRRKTAIFVTDGFEQPIRTGAGTGNGGA